MNLPQFCIPDAIKFFYTRLALFDENNIYSQWGPNWTDQVAALCEVVSADKCTELEATIGGGAEMSVTQLENMFQTDWTRSFT